MFNKISLLALVVAVSFSSCKKDEATKSKTELLTGTTWKVGKSTALGIDVTPTQACSKDDITNFSTDKKMTVKEGATKCSSSDPDLISQGTWAFSSDEKQLTITEDGDATTYTIKSLTSSECKLSIDFFGSSLGEITYVK